jgi:hypothetical protein
MEKFVNESLSLHWRWDRIALIGGEPSFHPEIFKLISVVKAYKDKYPKCSIQFYTNGYGPYVKSVISKLPKWLVIMNSQKTGRIQEFHPYNIAPIDVKKYHKAQYCEGCPVTNMCGMGLNRYGFYPCGAGAAVDRIFGLNIGIKHLSDISLEALADQMDKICRFCGHYIYYQDRNMVVQKQLYSKSWKRALKHFHAGSNILSLY